MTDRSFRAVLVAIAAAFVVLFAAIVPPALINDGFDFWGAARATFVNPYASGASIDVLMAYVVLAVWVFQEARTRRVRHGWIALVVGLVTGLTVAFAAYLLI